MQEHPPLHSTSQTLITGVYRTGSEYIAQLVGCHPNISVSMYSVNLLRFVYGRYEPISDLVQCGRALNDLEQRLMSRYNLPIDREVIYRSLAESGRITYGTLYDAVMCSLYLREPAEHWAEKNQLLWREIPSFLEMMPNGKAILVIRDPRSVLASFKRYTYAPPPAYLGAVFNCFDAMKHALKYQAELDPSRFLLIRYEDVAEAPQEAANKIWRFLDLAGSHVIGSSEKWKDVYGKPWHANSSFHPNGDARPFEIQNSINRWVTNLAPEEIALTEGICGDLMQQFGYELVCTSGVDWLSASKLFVNDSQIMEYFKLWSFHGEGIQAFPTDPHDPKNWRDNE